MCGKCIHWKKESDEYPLYDRTGDVERIVPAAGTCTYRLPAWVGFPHTKAHDHPGCQLFTPTRKR